MDWYCDVSGSPLVPSRWLQPVQVLPVPSRRSGLSAAALEACCSHSSPTGSQWPRRGPFSSSLDGRSVSLPSESCTQRCLCQPLCLGCASARFSAHKRKKRIGKKKRSVSPFFFLLLLHHRHFHFLLSISPSTGMLWKSFQHLPQSRDQACL